MSESRLVIAIDCDDVLVPAGQKTIQVYNDSYGTEVGLADLYDSPPEVWGLTSSDDVLVRIDACLRNNAQEFLQPFPEAVVAVKNLAQAHELHLVTGRRDFLEPITRRTLEEFFPGCFQTIEHTNHYAPSGESHLRRSKGEVCRLLGAHVLIDDHIAHIKSAIDYGIKSAVLFGNYPWNQISDLPHGVTHCYDWPSVEGEVSRLAEHAKGMVYG